MGWRIAVDQSPEWLFFRLSADADQAEAHPPLAEQMWAIANEHHNFRLVLELDDHLLLSSFLVGQCVLLHKRAHMRGGVFRVCGLSPGNYKVLELMGLAERLPNYDSREAAVMGRRAPL